MSPVLPGVWASLPEPSVAALPVDPSGTGIRCRHRGVSVAAQRSTMVHK